MAKKKRSVGASIGGGRASLASEERVSSSGADGGSSSVTIGRAEGEGQMFRSLADHSHEFIGMCDLEFRPFYVNEAGLRLVGLGSLEEACAVPVPEFFFPEDQRFIREEFFPKVLREGRGEVEIRFRHFKTGAALWMICNAFQVRDAGGLVSGYATVSRDITERKRGEEKLRESEERFRFLFKHMLDGFAYCRMLYENGSPQDFVYLSVNDSFERLTGLRDVVGKKVSEVIPGIRQSNPELLEIYGRVALTGRPERFETYVESLGIWFYVAVYSPQREHFVAVFDNVTVRKRAEEALRRAGEKQELLARTASALLVAEEPQKVVEELASAAMAFLGCEVFFNFLLDHSASRLRLNACGGVDPRLARKAEDLELAQSVCGAAAAAGQRVVAENVDQSEDARAEIVRRLGIRAYAAHPLLGAGGEVMGTLSFGTRGRGSFSGEDLELMKAVANHVAVAMRRRRAEAAVRESEERFRALADSIPNLAWWANADGYITWYNRRWYEYTGTTAEQMEGWGWQSVHEPEMLPSVLDRWRASIATGEPFEMEFPLRGADGKFRWFLTRVVPVRDEGGKVVRWFGTNTDVSEIREAREVLKGSRDELERLVNERTARLQELLGELEHFSYTITHDLKSPLRAMRGFAEMASMACGENGGKEAKQFLGKISTAAERMDRLIADALSYSRSVRQELPLEDVDAGALLRGMLDTYPELQPARARIQVEGRLPVVLANEAGLTQVFSNLLGNAVKFVKGGEKPEIRVWATEAPTHGRLSERVRIWVEDKGIGISKEMLPRVFDMFSRGSKDYEGTGIGLALVRKVAQRMGGKVGVESEEGQGSRFWIELSCGEAKASGGLAARPGSAEATARQGPVLYVEDEESDVLFMKQAFEKKGLASKLRVVGNGRAAIDYLSGSGEFGDREKYPAPAVVLLDLNLPQVSGFGVLEWMRSNPDYARTPVVVFSSSAREDDRLRAKELGANEFVAKPSSGMKFSEVVAGLQERWIAGRRA